MYRGETTVAWMISGRRAGVPADDRPGDRTRPRIRPDRLVPSIGRRHPEEPPPASCCVAA